MEEGEPNHEKEKFAEVEQVMRKFIVDAQHNENEFAFSPAEEANCAKVRIFIKPNSIERIDFPNGFFIELTGVAMIKEGSEDDFEYAEIKGDKPYVLYFKDAHFSVAGAEFNFEDICPGGTLQIENNSWKAVLNGVVGAFEAEGRIVECLKFNSPDDFITLLHEVGHAIDVKEREIKNYSDDSNPNSGERNAWAEALRIARKYKLSITKEILRHSAGSLKTYQEESPDEAVTDEKRKKVRKAGYKIKGTKLEK
jgi:hypothetical protein